MFKRLPLGHKPRGRQRPTFSPAARNGPTAQQSVVGTQTSTTPGVFSSASGGAGYRTLQAPPAARAPVQPFTFGFFTPFALGGAPEERTRPLVPFAAAASTPQRSAVMPAQPKTPQRSETFTVPPR